MHTLQNSPNVTFLSNNNVNMVNLGHAWTQINSHKYIYNKIYIFANSFYRTGVLTFYHLYLLPALILAKAVYLIS
jgi:hypothetical protein